MKKTTAQELVELFNERTGVKFQPKTFWELRMYINDFYHLFDRDYDDIFDFAEHSGVMTCRDRAAYLPTDAARKIYDEIHDSYVLSEEEAFEDSDTPYDVEDEECCTTLYDRDTIGMSEYLALWKEHSRRHSCEVEIHVGTGDDGVYGNHRTNWVMNCGECKGEDNFFEIVDDDGPELMGALYWLCELFSEESIEDFEKFDVELRYVTKECDNADEDAQQENGADEGDSVKACAKELCLRCKYEGWETVLKKYDHALELVKKHPLLFTQLPAEYKTSEMANAFIEANSVYRRRYEELQRDNARLEKESGAIRSGYLFHLPHRDEELAIKLEAVIDSRVDFGNATKDPAVLIKALTADDGWFTVFEITPENYDEKALVAAVRAVPHFIGELYRYWCDEIGKQPKVRESVKETFHLCDDATDGELARFQCLKMIDGKGEAEIFCLLNARDCYGGAESLNTDHIQQMRKAYAELSPALQRTLIGYRYLNGIYAQAEIFTDEMCEDIAKDCPLAGDFLPDRYIVKLGLKQSDRLEDIAPKCNECAKCYIRRLRIRW